MRLSMSIMGIGRFLCTASQQFKPFLDITSMIRSLPDAKTNAIVDLLKETLSKRLGKALDTKISYPADVAAPFSSVYASGHMPITRRLFPVNEGASVSLKDYFLNTQGLFTQDIIRGVQQEASEIATGKPFIFNIKSLQLSHEYLTGFISNPKIDPLVQKGLSDAAKKDGDYSFGFEIDVDETEKSNQLVFTIFEKDGEREISKRQIFESEL